MHDPERGGVQGGLLLQGRSRRRRQRAVQQRYGEQICISNGWKF